MSLKQEQMSLKQEEANAAFALKQEESNAAIQRLAASHTLSPPSQSPAVLGDKVLAKARRDGGIGLPQFHVSLGRPSIVPVGSMSHFKGKESDLVALMTPFLGPCFPPSCVIVNSEHFKWLDVESGDKNNDLKPDFEACHPAFYSSASHEDSIARDYVPLFGTISHPCLYGSVFAGAAKVSATPTALGELLTYLEWICYHSKRESLGMLVTKQECQLLQVERKVVTRFCRVPWEEAGSLEFVQGFFSSYDIPIARTLDSCCVQMEVEVVEGGSFLGRGGSGVVFKVKKGRDFQALKIVVNTADKPNAVQELEREFEASTNVTLDGLVIPAVSFFALPDHTSAGLLLAEAAMETANRSTPNIVDIIFRKLFELHSRGVTHGDPRLPNFVRCARSGWKWIDLRESATSTLSADFARDVKLLIENVIHPRTLSSLEDIEIAIRLYSSSPTSESMNAIVAKLPHF